MLVPQKIQIKLLYGPSVSLLGVYTKESKLAYNRDTGKPMFTVTQFIKSKSWNQPMSPKWING
jgi:hypothetical protein